MEKTEVVMENSLIQDETNTFLINLDSRTDRLEKSKKLLQEAGVSFSREGAVNGCKIILGDAEIENLKGDQWGMSPGAIGCFYSHLKLWKRLVSSNHPYYIIFEDDFTISEEQVGSPAGFKKALLELLEETKKDNVDLYTFGYISQKHVDIYRYGVSRVPKDKINTLQDYNCSTFGYVISKEGAKKLIAIDRKLGFTTPVDEQFKRAWETYPEFKARITPQAYVDSIINDHTTNIAYSHHNLISIAVLNNSELSKNLLVNHKSSQPLQIMSFSIKNIETVVSRKPQILILPPLEKKETGDVIIKRARYWNPKIKLGLCGTLNHLYSCDMPFFIIQDSSDCIVNKSGVVVLSAKDEALLRKICEL